MAEILVSLPGDLLESIDREALRRSITRDGLLLLAARRVLTTDEAGSGHAAQPGPVAVAPAPAEPDPLVW